MIVHITTRIRARAIYNLYDLISYVLHALRLKVILFFPMLCFRDMNLTIMLIGIVLTKASDDSRAVPSQYEDDRSELFMPACTTQKKFYLFVDIIYVSFLDN